MTDIERLVAIEEIKKLKARYYRFLDTKQWDDFENVFAPDAVMDMRGPDRILESEAGAYKGATIIRQFAERAIGAGTSTDRAFLPEIEILSPTSARAIWAQEDKVTWPPGHENAVLEGFGHEYESYERIDGEWKIQSTCLVRVSVKMTRS